MLHVIAHEAKVTSPPRSDQDRLNRRIYTASHVTRYYRSVQLEPAEMMALLRHQPAFAGRDVLDLGVGTGRTTKYLAPLARKYVGIDSSPMMIDFMRRRFPKVEVRPGDLRDLSEFPDESFDFVFGPCNVLDAVSHADRLRVLAEVHRVLRPSGLLAFSSHNRRFRTALSGPRLHWSRNPSTQLLHGLRYLRSVINHARVGPLRRVETSYAVLNDEGHDYAVLHYYISRDTQQRQLEQAGFRVLDELDAVGRLLQPDDDDSGSPSVLYVAARGSSRE
jgi:SAM-dependent methyltransferase